MEEEKTEASIEEAKNEEEISLAESQKKLQIKMNVNIHQIIFSYFTAFEQYTKAAKLCSRERNAMLKNKENPEFPPRNL